MVLDFSSPTRNKRLICATPAPAKSFGRLPKYIEEQDETPTKGKKAIDYLEHFDDRGSRFNEDFIEI